MLNKNKLTYCRTEKGIPIHTGTGTGNKRHNC
jgi:hypothetical protein